jgi:hypothetical protein
MEKAANHKISNSRESQRQLNLKRKIAHHPLIHARTGKGRPGFSIEQKVYKTDSRISQNTPTRYLKHYSGNLQIK